MPPGRSVFLFFVFVTRANLPPYAWRYWRLCHAPGFLMVKVGIALSVVQEANMMDLLHRMGAVSEGGEHCQWIDASVALAAISLAGQSAGGRFFQNKVSTRREYQLRFRGDVFWSSDDEISRPVLIRAYRVPHCIVDAGQSCEQPEEEVLRFISASVVTYLAGLRAFVALHHAGGATHHATDCTFFVLDTT